MCSIQVHNNLYAVQVKSSQLVIKYYCYLYLFNCVMCCVPVNVLFLNADHWFELFQPVAITTQLMLYLWWKEIRKSSPKLSNQSKSLWWEDWIKSCIYFPGAFPIDLSALVYNNKSFRNKLTLQLHSYSNLPRRGKTVCVVH